MLNYLKRFVAAFLHPAGSIFIFLLFYSRSPEWWPEKLQPRSQSEELTASQPEASLKRQLYTALPAQQH